MHWYYDYQYNDIMNDTMRDNACIKILNYYKYCNKSVSTKKQIFEYLSRVYFHLFNIISIFLIDIKIRMNCKQL